MNQSRLFQALGHLCHVLGDTLLVRQAPDQRVDLRPIAVDNDLRWDRRGLQPAFHRVGSLPESGYRWASALGVAAHSGGSGWKSEAG